MARYKDGNWTITDAGSVPYEQAQLAVLMDLRDELKEIKQVLQRTFLCHNTLDIPHKLDKIVRNTTPQRKKKVAQ